MAATASRDPLEATLRSLASRAARTIGEHTNRDGRCLACGASWPCEKAILASHNLELASGPIPERDNDNTAKRCDNRSVGVIITDGQGRYLVFDRNTYPPGVAACAGHVDDHGIDEDAARSEVLEEVGLVIDLLVLLATGWRDNPCRRMPGPKGRGHEWAVFVATAHGTLSPSPRETRNPRWVTRLQLQALFARTLALATDAISLAEFEDLPGLEPSWPLWFSLTGAVRATDVELALIDRLFDRLAKAAED
jgi:8-oxo-dGTP pyrophosphatase MutT (NUDIX family)